MLVWGNLCKKQDLNRLSKVQNACVQLIDPKLPKSEVYSKHKILKINELIKLEEIRFGFKITNKLLPNNLQLLVDHDQHGYALNKNHTYNTRNKQIPNLPHTDKQIYRNSFLYLKLCWQQ